MYRFKINLALVVEAETAEEAMNVATRLVSPRIPAESFRLTLQGDLYGVGVRGGPRHRKGVRAKASRDDGYAIRPLGAARLPVHGRYVGGQARSLWLQKGGPRMAEDVVVKKVELGPFAVNDWGRGSIEVAREFCRRPKEPARLSDHFIGVDDWGHGTIVCATPDLSNWIGTSFRRFCAEAH